MERGGNVGSGQAPDEVQTGGADVQAVRAHDSVRGNPASGNGSDGLELQRGASPVAVKGPAPSGGWVSINHGLTKHRMVPKFF